MDKVSIRWELNFQPLFFLKFFLSAVCIQQHLQLYSWNCRWSGKWCTPSGWLLVLSPSACQWFYVRSGNLLSIQISLKLLVSPMHLLCLTSTCEVSSPQSGPENWWKVNKSINILRAWIFLNKSGCFRSNYLCALCGFFFALIC